MHADNVLALNIKVNGIFCVTCRDPIIDLENVNRIDNLFQGKDQDGAQVWHEELDSTKVAKGLALGSLA